DDLDATPDYSGALSDVANLIVPLLSAGCIPAPLVDPAHPDCVVEDVTRDDNGNVIAEHQFGMCTLDGSNMPKPDNQFPCWAVLPKAECTKDLSPEGVGVTIFRNGMQPPSNTSLRVECSTVALPPH